MNKTAIQFVKFAIVGFSNTAIAYLLNISVLLILRPSKYVYDYLIANVVAFMLSVLWSFYWNNKYVFTLEKNQKRSMWKALIKTYMSYGFSGLILSNVMSWLWISVLGVSKYVAPLINLTFTVPINYILNKMWAFNTIDKDTISS